MIELTTMIERTAMIELIAMIERTAMIDEVADRSRSDVSIYMYNVHVHVCG